MSSGPSSPESDPAAYSSGSGAREVEERVTRPMEKLLWEIAGVEYVSSTSREGSSRAVVRFYVGEDLERSVVRVHHQLRANL